MYNWFQNLNKEFGNRQLFYFRGALGPDYKRQWFKYELSSGFAFRLKVKVYPYHKLSLSLGLLFFTAYLTIPFFSFKRWIKEPLETGFYFYHWSFIWDWMDEEWGNGRQPTDAWWKHIYFHIDDFFLGEMEMLEDTLLDADNIKFKLGGKDFVMDSIEWSRRRQFRRYIPYVLWHHSFETVNMKIKDPPMRSGKGENSYDCGDDGSFGLSCQWKGTKPTWSNKSKCAREAVAHYAQHVLEAAAKYGGSKSERGINKNGKLEFVIGLDSHEEFKAGHDQAVAQGVMHE